MNEEVLFIEVIFDLLLFNKSSLQENQEENVTGTVGKATLAQFHWHPQLRHGHGSHSLALPNRGYPLGIRTSQSPYHITWSVFSFIHLKSAFL